MSVTDNVQQTAQGLLGTLMPQQGGGGTAPGLPAPIRDFFAQYGPFDTTDVLIFLLRHPYSAGSSLPQGASAPENNAVLVLARGHNDRARDIAGLVERAQHAPTAPFGSPVLGWMFGFGQLHDVLQSAQGFHQFGDLVPDHGNTALLTTEHNFDGFTFDGMPGGAVFSSPNAEDFIHSMVAIAPPGTVIECFNERDHRDVQGQLNVQVGPAGFVAIPNLSEVREGDLLPAGSAHIQAQPTGRYDVVSSMSWPGGDHHIDSFAGEMSSIRVDLTAADPLQIPGHGTTLSAESLDALLASVQTITGTGTPTDTNTTQTDPPPDGGLLGGLPGVGSVLSTATKAGITEEALPAKELGAELGRIKKL